MPIENIKLDTVHNRDAPAIEVYGWNDIQKTLNEVNANLRIYHAMSIAERAQLFLDALDTSLNDAYIGKVEWDNVTSARLHVLRELSVRLNQYNSAKPGIAREKAAYEVGLCAERAHFVLYSNHYDEGMERTKGRRKGQAESIKTRKKKTDDQKKRDAEILEEFERMKMKSQTMSAKSASSHIKKKLKLDISERTIRRILSGK